MAEILLGNIKGPKGEQGKAFEFSDFTPEQLEALRGPQGVPGVSTKIVTVEFKTRPTYQDFGGDNGGTTGLGGVPDKYYGVLNAGDFVVIPMVHEDDGSDVIVVGEFVEYQYNSNYSGFGIIFKNLAAIKGSTGPAGAKGATFTPAVSAEGVLSWSNNGGLTNPTSVNVKGAKGDTGATGATFTPNVDADGNISWTNDAGLTNPPTINIRGPQGPAGGGGSGGGSGDAIPKTGNRGVLAGYETLSIGTVVSQDSPDFQSIGPFGETFDNVEVRNGVDGTCWVKCVACSFASLEWDGLGVSVTLGDRWTWANETAPAIGGMSGGVLVCVWLGDCGWAFFVECLRID